MDKGRCGGGDGYPGGIVWVAADAQESQEGWPGWKGDGRCRENQWAPRLGLGIPKEAQDGISSRQPEDHCPEGNMLLLPRIRVWKGKAHKSVFQ